MQRKKSGKTKVQGTNLVRKPNTKHNTTSSLERVVAYTALWNEEAVELFLEEAQMPIGATTEDTVRNAMVVIGVGKAEKLQEFLDLHPDKELFTPEKEEQQKAVQTLMGGKKDKTAPKLWQKAWIKLAALLAFLLLVFVLVYLYMKSEK